MSKGLGASVERRCSGVEAKEKVGIEKSDSRVRKIELASNDVKNHGGSKMLAKMFELYSAVTRN